jgi:hypothetical protein
VLIGPSRAGGQHVYGQNVQNSRDISTQACVIKTVIANVLHQFDFYLYFYVDILLGTFCHYADRGSRARGLVQVRKVGVSLSLIVMFAFFSLATPPGFNMGTYELLVDKGPLGLPVFAALVTGRQAAPMQCTLLCSLPV